MNWRDRPVFWVSAILVAVFVVLGATLPELLGEIFNRSQRFIISQLGWFYIVSVGFFLLFVLWLLVSPYGKIRLGKDDEEPEFSTFTWFAMLFSAGMGIGLLFFSVAEPVSHFAAPPRVDPGPPAVEQMQTIDAELQPLLAIEEPDQETAQQIATLQAEFREAAEPAYNAAREAMTITFFHWGLHAWAIYIIMGLSLAYFSYRHDLPLTIRSAFFPLLGERVHGPAGKTIEVLAILGTVFGVATSLGLGASQIAAGMEHLGWIAPANPGGESGIPVLQVGIIVVITLIATISVVTGLKVGIRRLSEFNLLLGLALLLFVFIAGPTVFLLSSYVQAIGHYAQSLVELTFRTDAYRGTEWQEGWTMFYWAWWIAWCPFVGMFIARVSRGRTLRQFILGTLLAPALLAFLWLVVFGNTALHQQIYEGIDLVAVVAEGQAMPLFVMLSNLPVAPILATLTSIVAMIVIATYFITSSDSASLVVDILSHDGDPDPPVGSRVFWALTEGAVAAVLLLAGGLPALQTGAIITALPVCAILLFICLSLTTALRRERHWVEARRIVRRRRRDAQLTQLLEDLEPAMEPQSAAADREEMPLEAVPETGGATIGIDPPKFEDGEPSADWRRRLARIVSSSEAGKARRPSVDVERVREQINEFLDDVVVPAFKEVRKELQAHEREAAIEKHPYQAVLIVKKDGKEEFSYAVRGRAYHKLSFAFPEMTDDREPRILRAEVVLPSGPRPDYRVHDFSREGIIRDFLEEYARWRGVTPGQPKKSPEDSSE